jgi:hypothetical protein
MVGRPAASPVCPLQVFAPFFHYIAGGNGLVFQWLGL